MKTSIYRSLSIRIVLPVLVVLVVIELFNYYNTKDMLLEASREKSKIITEEIKTIQQFQDLSLRMIEKRMDERMRSLSDTLVNTHFSNTQGIEHRNLKRIRQEMGMQASMEDIYVINSNGIVINTTFEQDYNLDFFSFGIEHKEYLLNILYGEKFVSERFAIEQKTKRPKKYSYQPTNDGKYIVEIGLYSEEADQIIDFVNTRLSNLSHALGNIKSVDLFIAAEKPFSLSKEVVIDDAEMRTLRDITINKTKYTNVEQENANNIFIEYIYQEERSDALYKGSVIRIISDRSVEMTALRNKVLNSFIISSTVALIIILIVIRIVYTRLTNPLNRASAILRKLAKGDIYNTWKMDIKSQNEVGVISESLNNMIDMMINTTNFARKIGQGNLNADYEIKSNNDELGKALLEMRDNLRKLEEENTRRDIAEEIQSWVTSGVAKFGDLIRQNADNLQNLSDKCVKGIVRYLQANQCGFFVLNDDNSNDVHLELIATFAYDRKKYSDRRISTDEGYVGMCFNERNTIYRTDLPNDYIEITSGLGGANPKSLLIVPLKINENVYGVIEIASFKPFKDFHIQFVERVAENIASVLHTLRNTERNRQLLERMSQQANRFDAEKASLEKEISDLLEKLQRATQREEEQKYNISQLQQELLHANQRLELLSEKSINQLVN